MLKQMFQSRAQKAAMKKHENYQAGKTRGLEDFMILVFQYGKPSSPHKDEGA